MRICCLNLRKIHLLPYSKTLKTLSCARGERELFWQACSHLLTEDEISNFIMIWFSSEKRGRRADLNRVLHVTHLRWLSPDILETERRISISPFSFSSSKRGPLLFHFRKLGTHSDHMPTPTYLAFCSRHSFPFSHTQSFLPFFTSHLTISLSLSLSTSFFLSLPWQLLLYFSLI